MKNEAAVAEEGTWALQDAQVWVVELLGERVGIHFAPFAREITDFAGRGVVGAASWDLATDKGIEVGEGRGTRAGGVDRRSMDVVS